MSNKIARYNPAVLDQLITPAKYEELLQAVGQLELNADDDLPQLTVGQVRDTLLSAMVRADIVDEGIALIMREPRIDEYQANRDHLERIYGKITEWLQTTIQSFDRYQTEFETVFDGEVTQTNVGINGSELYIQTEFPSKELGEIDFYNLIAYHGWKRLKQISGRKGCVDVKADGEKWRRAWWPNYGVGKKQLSVCVESTGGISKYSKRFTLEHTVFELANIDEHMLKIVRHMATLPIYFDEQVTKRNTNLRKI